MALIASVLRPAEDGVVFTLATVTASATKAAPSRIFTITCDQTCTITWGHQGATPATPSATVGHLIPANAPETFDMGSEAGGLNMKFFNTSGSTTSIGITPFSNN